MAKACYGAIVWFFERFFSFLLIRLAGEELDTMAAEEVD